MGEVATFSPSKTFFESPGSVAASGEASLPLVPFVGEVATFSPSKTFFESPGSVAASGEASLPPVPLVGEVASGEALELGLQR